jgi:K+-sensing histidine kinase KdpD
MDVREYTIDGDDLEQLLAEIAEGGFTGVGTYKLVVRHYPTARKVSFSVNDTGPGLPMGELTNVIRA